MRLDKNSLAEILPSLRLAFASNSLALFLCFLTVVFCLVIRQLPVDPAILMLYAKEYFAGRRLYTQLYDFATPSDIYLYWLPILFHDFTGLSTTYTWNFYVLLNCALAGLFVATKVPREQWLRIFCYWIAGILLLFDDVYLGEREFFFGLYWIPYLLFRLYPRSSFESLFSAGVCAVILSVIICAKPHLALFILLIDLPLLVKRRSWTALFPIFVLTIAGLGQLADFLLRYDLNAYFGTLETLSYYKEVGIGREAYIETIEAVLSSPILWGSLFFLVVTINGLREDVTLGWCLIGTVAVTAALLVAQGQLRRYCFVPIFIVTLFSFIFYAPKLWALIANRLPTATLGRRAICLAALLIGGATLYHDTTDAIGGFFRAVEHRRALGQLGYYVGMPPDDIYEDWVRSHVKSDEHIAVIALQYQTAALDPVASSVRLNRRVISHSPVTEFPLRVALRSKDSELIDRRVREIIGDIEDSGARWLILSRLLPNAMPYDGELGSDFVKLMGTVPLFSQWRDEHFTAFDQFGPYVAYRRK